MALAIGAMTVSGGAALARTGSEPSQAALAEARERFAEVRRLEDAGQWNEALALLQQVAVVKMTPQVRFHIALCMEHIGLFTRAMDQYGRALEEARGTPAPEVTAEATEHLERLNRLTPTITVAVVGARASDEVLLDGRAIPVGSPPLSIRVDPGPHRVELLRDGDVIGRRYFAAKPTTTQRVELRPAIDQDTAATNGATMRAAGWASLGVGAASTVFTGVMFGLRADAMSDLERACPTPSSCPPSSRSVTDEIDHRASTYSALGTVGAVVSGLTLATGAILLLTAPSPARAAPIAHGPTVVPLPYLSANGGGVGLVGTF